MVNIIIGTIIGFLFREFLYDRVISFIFWIQIKIIILCWGRIPVLTTLQIYKENRTINMERLWLKPKNGIIKFGKTKTARIANKEDLFFIHKFIFINPFLCYLENDIVSLNNKPGVFSK